MNIFVPPRLFAYVVSLMTFVQMGAIQPVPEGLLRLAAAYPDFIREVSPFGLTMHDGTYFSWDDGKVKTPEEIINNPDLEEMMALPYRAEETPAVPTEFDEAGRLRYEPFFSKMYGGSAEEVRKKMKEVVWLPGWTDQVVKVNATNGIADSLQKVSYELAMLPREYQKYLTPIGGVFNWRSIRGSSRLSMHAYAIAIDINPKYGNYWDWEKDENGHFEYKNLIPQAIVRIFEKYGFIWGGRWRHHDTMHFEYRPELLIKRTNLRQTDVVQKLSPVVTKAIQLTKTDAHSHSH